MQRIYIHLLLPVGANIMFDKYTNTFTCVLYSDCTMLPLCFMCIQETDFEVQEGLRVVS